MWERDVKGVRDKFADCVKPLAAPLVIRVMPTTRKLAGHAILSATEQRLDVSHKNKEANPVEEPK